MAVSMTGYGKSVSEDGDLSIKVEIKSVNSRYLDINFKSTRVLSFMEEKIRIMIKSVVTRGKIDIYIGLRGDAGNSKIVTADYALAESYADAVKELKGRLRLRGNISTAEMALVPGIFTVRENEPNEDKLTPLVAIAVKKALDAFIEMKKTEGRSIEIDMLLKLEEMKETLLGVEKSKDGLTESFKEKLILKMKELLEGTGADASRIAQEAAFFADKACVDEEITRLHSHIGQFEESITKSSVGRKMDFIIQEMNREANTIGSKSASLELTNYVLNLKCIIEKLREQAQNIE